MALYLSYDSEARLAPCMHCRGLQAGGLPSSPFIKSVAFLWSQNSTGPTASVSFAAGKSDGMSDYGSVDSRERVEALEAEIEERHEELEILQKIQDMTASIHVTPRSERVAGRPGGEGLRDLTPPRPTRAPERVASGIAEASAKLSFFQIGRELERLRRDVGGPYSTPRRLAPALEEEEAAAAAAAAADVGRHVLERTVKARELERDEAIARANAYAAALAAARDEALTRAEGYSSLLSEATRRVAAKDGEIAVMARELEARDAEIHARIRELSETHAHIEARDEALAGRDRDIAAARDDAARLGARVAALAAIVEQRGAHEASPRLGAWVLLFSAWVSMPLLLALVVTIYPPTEYRLAS